MLTAPEKKFLRDGLPRGYGIRIALEAGVSQTCVSAYFSNKFNCERVETVTLRLFLEYKEEMRAKTKDIFDK